MVTLQEAKAMRDALRAAMVTAKTALSQCSVVQQFDMMLPHESRMHDWNAGRLSIYVDKASETLSCILWMLNRADEEEAAKEVQK